MYKDLRISEEALIMIRNWDYKKLYCNDSIEGLLPICPICKDTKNITQDSTVTLYAPYHQTLRCNYCMVYWDCFFKEK